MVMHATYYLLKITNLKSDLILESRYSESQKLQNTYSGQNVFVVMVPTTYE